MNKIVHKYGRYSLILSFTLWFLACSLFIRVCFFIWQHNEVSCSLFDLARTLLTGLFFDLGTITYFSLPGILYYSFMPDKWIGSVLDKILICFFTSLMVFILVFTFVAELTFWDEFKTRFNFIAVDYLIYTHEVIANIRESYPLEVLIGGVVLLSAGFLFVFYKKKNFQTAFNSKASLTVRLSVLLPAAGCMLFYSFFITNNQAEWSQNRYNCEISKSGIYSFFAAFRNNQMKYTEFYTSIDSGRAFGIIKKKLADPNSLYSSRGYSIHRKITAPSPSDDNKNVIFILVESLSGSFLKEFGNKENITPFLDSLAQESIFFEDLYATGTRTVRGMEAVTLCIPPTPGQSIVKRPENQNLYTVCSVFKSRGYDCGFFYGGDGYFDNMNAYFGGSGFTIYDRGRGSLLSDKIKTVRHNISDKEVSFENAWGICDEDLYNKMLKTADKLHADKKPFFNFVMTTSNHRPYTYPSGKIDIPPGTGRQGAVKYTDYALGELLRKAKTKPWYSNTVFVIIADHCASSAGRNEIDAANYRIPAFIVNLDGHENQKIKKQCSQIDLFPTLFYLFRWNYESDFFGKNVLDPNFEQRAFVGTYRKLALMKKDRIMVLSDQKKQTFYRWEKQDNILIPIVMNHMFLQETISWYQTADFLFTNKLLR
jgi:phosphoglycerol transferase MdoB-like AlkP superfamily enzyme